MNFRLVSVFEEMKEMSQDSMTSLINAHFSCQKHQRKNGCKKPSGQKKPFANFILILDLTRESFLFYETVSFYFILFFISIFLIASRSSLYLQVNFPNFVGGVVLPGSRIALG